MTVGGQPAVSADIPQAQDEREECKRQRAKFEAKRGLQAEWHVSEQIERFCWVASLRVPRRQHTTYPPLANPDHRQQLGKWRALSPHIFKSSFVLLAQGEAQPPAEVLGLSDLLIERYIIQL